MVFFTSWIVQSFCHPQSLSETSGTCDDFCNTEERDVSWKSCLYVSYVDLHQLVLCWPTIVPHVKFKVCSSASAFGICQMLKIFIEYNKPESYQLSEIKDNGFFKTRIVILLSWLLNAHPLEQVAYKLPAQFSGSPLSFLSFLQPAFQKCFSQCQNKSCSYSEVIILLLCLKQKPWPGYYTEPNFSLLTFCWTHPNCLPVSFFDSV